MFGSGNRNSALKGSVIGLLALAASALAVPAQATVFVLADGNSTATVDTESQAGMSSWKVDGVENLSKQWFWYRIGDGPEASIDALTLDFELATDLNGTGGDNNLFVRYLGAGFKIEINYGLIGGVAGGGNADVAETITITNTSGSTIEDFHFFQYSDFDLGGVAGDDTVQFINDNTVRQSGSGTVLNEMVVSPQADHFEAALHPVTLGLLNDVLATTLSDSPAGSLGPGDVTWAYQWDFTLAASGVGSDFQISKDKRMGIDVPEPSTLSVLALGLAAFAYRRRRQNRA